jgi:putative flippase GtrA
MIEVKKLVNEVVFEKTTNTYIQFLRYIFVGAAATVVDVGSLYVFTSKLGIYYLTSAALAFCLGIVTNYLLSILWVFKSTGNLKKEITLFLLIGLSGLLLNELIIWVLVSKLSIYYLVSKLVATAIILIWNFGLRKKIVFS